MTDDEAERAFVAIRFAETEGRPVCPWCGCTESYAISTRKKWKCKACLKQFSATSRTIFASRKLSYKKILFAIATFVNGAKGYAALHLSRDIRCTPKTAFVLEHKLREVMEALQTAHVLSGEVEIDGAYFGGHVRPTNRRSHRRDRRMLANKSPKRRCVFVARERRGRSRVFICSESDGAVLVPSIVQPETILYADQAVDFNPLHAFFDIRRIDHSKCYADGEISTNQAESYFARLRRSARGIHHHLSPQYLHAYANEMAWREDNRRLSNGDQFLTIAAAGMRHPVSRQWKGYWQRRKGTR
jgi:transposase-like protein